MAQADGQEQLVRHLHGAGARRIVLLARESSVAQHWETERQRGYAKACTALGIAVRPVVRMVAGSFEADPERTFRARVRLLAGHLLESIAADGPFDAICCLSDGEVALAAAACRLLGVECHGRFAGFDHDYRNDLLPAAASIGVSHITIGNVNRSAASEGTRGNQCCSHGYEPAPALGGTVGLRRLVSDAKALGLRLRSWTSTAQGFDSPLLAAHRNDPDWFLRMEDGATTFGSVHMSEFHCLNLAHAPARRVWLDAMLRIMAETGLDAWFLDMFPNVSFMPLSFAHGRVTTIWRACLEALAELQGAGIECDGGSPTFVRPLAGGHTGFDRPENRFVNHRIYQKCPARDGVWTQQELRRCVAHGSAPGLDLFTGSTRIDALWTPGHRQELALLARLRPLMQRRRIVPGGVDWLDAQGRLRLSFALDRRHVRWAGPHRDAVTGAQAAADGVLQSGAVVLHPWDADR